MSVSPPDWPTSPLHAADTAFAALTCDPAPMTLDLDRFGPDAGLPGSVMALPALRDWLLAHPRAYTARDTVWRELVRRARLDGPAGGIAAGGVGVAAPLRYPGQVFARHPRRPAGHQRRNP